MAEEVGITATHDDMMFCCVAQRKSGEREYVAYEFVITLDENQEPLNNEPELCEELIWCDPLSLPDDVIADFAAIVSDGYCKKIPYLELGY